MLGGYALGNATQDLDDGRTPIVRLRPERAGEQVEDGATGRTAVIQDRRPMAVMRGLIRGQGMPMRTAQAVRMQDAHQKVVAGLFIQHIVERKVQPPCSSLTPWCSTIGAAEGMPSWLYTSDPT